MGRLGVLLIFVAGSTQSDIRFERHDVETPAPPYNLEAADFDGDGDPDLATADQTANTVTVHVNDGAAGFAVGQTIEGIANGATLHPVQRQLLEHAGLQCGVCTPGVVVAAKALLDENPEPSEEEVRYWLAGNLCRCTGYDKIVRAVLAAAGELQRGDSQ